MDAFPTIVSEICDVRIVMQEIGCFSFQSVFCNYFYLLVLSVVLPLLLPHFPVFPEFQYL